ncbi:MAG: Hsp20/alpha crystallin family protein, partial [Candidatus Omnitrophota bacterium]|nr:Hsp20/alpha crystallin family protein [Candidatus Omnitrophota bacterium]
MELMKWKQERLNDPFKEFFDFESPLLGYSLFPITGKGWNGTRGQLIPAIDVAEDKDNVIIKADMPGLKKEEISVSLDNDVLMIRGERKSEVEKKEKNFHRVERSCGIFERSLS